MKRFLIFCIYVLMSYLVITIGTNWYTEDNIKEENNIIVETSSKQDTSKIELKLLNQWHEEEKGFNVIAKLDIPTINLKTNVLDVCNENSLYVSVCKFWGCDPNEVGNFCIAGHNYYKRKNMFYNLKKLKQGDKLYLEDRNKNIVEYEVIDVSKVEPTNTDCLDEDTDGRRELTLITCTQDSKKRIIVKAREL